MKKIVVLILLIVAAVAAYKGYDVYQAGNKSVSVLGLDISASDQDTTQEAYLFFGIAAVVFLASLVVWSRR